MSTALLACWHRVAGRGVSPAGEQSTTRSVYIYLFRGASQRPSERATYRTRQHQPRDATRRDELLEWVHWGNTPSSSLPLFRPLTLAPLHSQRRRGRFLSIDPLLTTLDQSQATTSTHRPRGRRAAVKRGTVHEASRYRTTEARERGAAAAAPLHCGSMNERLTTTSTRLFGALRRFSRLSFTQRICCCRFQLQSSNVD